MSYDLALKEAGATVHLYKSFGSYQGDWWALVTFKGIDGWINGSYGSCSYCDAFEGEFDSLYHHCGLDDFYDPGENGFRDDVCIKCKELKKQLGEFGKGYLDGLLTQEEAMKHASENLEWDMDAQEMVDWIKENKF